MNPCGILVHLHLTILDKADYKSNFTQLICSPSMRNLSRIRVVSEGIEAEDYIDDLLASLHMLPNLDTFEVGAEKSAIDVDILKDTYTEAFRVRGVDMICLSESVHVLPFGRCRRRESHQ